MLWMLLVIVLAAVGVHVAARRSADKIKALPNPYPLETLKQPLTGEEKTLTRSDGTKIWTIAKGQGPTVVFAHGYGVHSDEWNVIWDMLQGAGYRTIAFDLRGHGKSSIGSGGLTSQQMADDLCTVLQAYDVRDAVLVGHSTGGFLSLLFMATQPQLAAQHLKGAVAVGALAGSATKDNPQNAAQIPMIKTGVMQSIMKSDPYGWFFGASLCGDQPFPAAIEAFNPIFLQQDHKQLIPVLEFLSKEDHYNELSNIKQPVVVVCGEADKTAPRWHSETIGKNIPNARNVWVKGKGHILNWEAPEVIVEAVQSFQ
jgi:non-heme chloroperoxidase